MVLAKLRDSIDRVPSRVCRNVSESSEVNFHLHTSSFSEADESSTNHVASSGSLGANAFLPYSAILARGSPCRPLEFPAPCVDRAMTISAQVVDHRTGNVFRATSVLMKRPIHAKACQVHLENRIKINSAAMRHNCGAFPPLVTSATYPNPIGHDRTSSRDSLHSWHGSSNATNSTKHYNHTNHTNNSDSADPPPPCGPACHLPDRAYCVRRKICDTLYGSIRLCVVMRRISRHDTQNADIQGIHFDNAFEDSPCPISYRHSHPGRRGNVDMLVEVPAWETTDQMVAIKVVNWSKLQQFRGRHLEDPIKELAAMQLLGNYHPNVIALLDSLQDETHLFCVYPFISGGDLYGRLWDDMRRSPTGRVEEARARAWFRQILSALSHLQKKGVCHRDLCMENMMVDEHDNIRIIDFGLCLRVPYEDPNNRNLVTDVSANTMRRLIKAQGQGGKWEYMAPEVAMRQEYFDGFAIDLWAVGIVLFELLIGKKPFAMPDAVDKNFHAISIREDLAGLLRMKDVTLNHEALDLLQKMLRCDPAKRLTLSEVANHPWVRHGCEWKEEKKSLTPIEEMNSWFIKNNAIDDSHEGDVSSRLWFHSCLSTSRDDDCDDNTADISDDESRNPPKYKSKSSTSAISHSLPYNISDEQLSETSHKMNELPTDAQNSRDTLSTNLDVDMVDKINTKKKNKGITTLLKPLKWLGSAKAVSYLSSFVSSYSSFESTTSNNFDNDASQKVSVNQEDRIC